MAPSTASWTHLLTISSRKFLLTVVDIMVIWIKFSHSHPFSFIDSQDVNVHSWHLLLDHIQFTLIHRLNIPGCYAVFFFLQHWTLLSPPDTSTEQLFPLCPNCFILTGAISNCSLLFPSSILNTFQPRELIIWCHIFFLPFMLSIGFSRQDYYSRLPFPSPVDYFLSELFTMTWLSWVTMHGMAHSLIEFCKPSSQKHIQLFTAVLFVCVFANLFFKFIYLCVCVKCESLSVVSDSLWPHGL